MELADRLWNDDVDQSTYAGDAAAYSAAVLEQYKLYTESADRVSQRRGLANTFFLTVNTAIFTLVGVFWRDRPEGSAWWLIFPLVAVLAECFAWFYLVRSYRLLNTAKYRVIGELETRLPASPYWSAEWWQLGEGTDWRRYWPLTHIEKWIPMLFAATYVGGFVAVLVSAS